MWLYWSVEFQTSTNEQPTEEKLRFYLQCNDGHIRETGGIVASHRYASEVLDLVILYLQGLPVAKFQLNNVRTQVVT
ncbi:hypothetical protein TNCV_4281261 [Trichonephila clavipes]|nr:hypothetical protein TNCV_4281261 [Trichonephila clavipes]